MKCQIKVKEHTLWIKSGIRICETALHILYQHANIVEITQLKYTQSEVYTINEEKQKQKRGIILSSKERTDWKSTLETNKNKEFKLKYKKLN